MGRTELNSLKRILLLDGEGVQVVCMARELNKLGCEVSALCAQKVSSGYATKYLHHRYKSPDVRLQEEAFKSYFYEHLKEHKYDLIIPMGDVSAYFLSREKEAVEQQYDTPCAVESDATFELANDKQKLMEVCKRYDIVHPKTRELSIESLDSVADYVGFPAMIKPNLSAGARGIVKVENKGELHTKFPPIAKEFGKCTLQQYVEQPDYYYNVMLFRRRDGKTAASTVIKIRRFFPLKGGSSCYSETVEHPFLLKQCERCLEKLNWHGFADFDVLEDKVTGELKIIEINPRVPSSLQASFAAGVNFAKIFVDEYLGSGAEVFDMSYYKVGQQVRWFGLDVMWFLMCPQRFSFRPSWFRFWGKNVSYHDGTLADPLPMIAGSLQGVVKYLDPNFRKAKLKG
ncbi:MAG: ATP-grasp domain-containing protein [Bacteroidales bacterium]|nr:ATP-grasp domain-containing protein [Bacteroidales bacterium]